MRLTVYVTALVALTACSPSIPESGAGFGAPPDPGVGVGFTDPAVLAQRRAAREAQLQGNALPPARAISNEQTGPGQPISAVRQPITTASGGAVTPTGGPQYANTAEDLARETQARLAETSQNSGQSVLHASPSNPAPQTVTSPTGISVENDFNAVGNERSIEDDAALIAQNRSQYRVVQPTALPTRSSSSGPNIVQYALQTRHPLGQKVYNRVGFNKEKKFRQNCAKYPSADLAQEDFLAKGGPKKDKLSLDPDGDGYACNWDPRPFRNAVGG
ncbi:MAG: hypothetical protein AAF066_07710 [Pseudomonadota bacterium]